MKKQKSKFIRATQSLLMTSVVSFGCISSAGAQTNIPDDGENHTYLSNEPYTEVKIPAGTQKTNLYLEIKAGDGGASNNFDGGVGATTFAVFEIGSASDQIQPNSTLRLIPGKSGRSHDSSGNDGSGAGGGGGSAVLLLGPGKTDWGASTILLVAGGGGGGGTEGTGSPGNSAEIGTGGNSGHGNLPNGGSVLNAGGSTYTSSGGAAAMKTASKITNDKILSCGPYPAAQAGYPNGGAGASCVLNGGWGFGGGGGGNRGGGGGGGYSGGGGGGTDYDGDDCCDAGGGGGGSYINKSYTAAYSYVQSGGRTENPANGYIKYGLIDIQTIKLAKKTAKCMDLTNSNTSNGTNVQLYSCNGTSAQQWLIDGLQFRILKDLDKCLDLDYSKTDNGTNVHLWTCSSTTGQQWFYDGITKNIRSMVNQDKCIDDVNAYTADGTNIQLWDCNDIAAQRWLFVGAYNPVISSDYNRIHFVQDTNKCVDVENGNTTNGTNVRIYHCNTGNGQHWYFDGRTLRFNKDRNKCLDLDNSKTDNGTNIRLWDCDDTKAQQWTYDGLKRVLRSGINPNKCIDLLNGKTTDGTNIQLWDCQEGNSNQQFSIGQ